MAVALASLLLLSCESMTKQDMGTVIGGALGATVGALLIDDDLWFLGAAAGGALGGLIGNQIGKYLDERDKELLAQSTQEALHTGKRQTFKNPESGVTGEVIIEEEEQISGNAELPVLKDSVDEVPPLEFVGEPFRARKTANVRGGPGTDYRVVGRVEGDRPVRVVGKVQDQNWFMISKGGVGSGYVYSPLLKRLHSSQPAQFQAEPAPPAEEVETVDLAYTTKCRKVLQRVRAQDGTMHEDRMGACAGSDGWTPL